MRELWFDRLIDVGRVNCHKGNKLAFIEPKKGIKFYGGGLYRGLVIEKDLTLVNLTGSPKAILTVNFKPQYIEAQKEVIVNWEDGEVAPLSRNDWTNILKEVVSIGKDVLVFCMGGHGRTGTALAILGGLCGAFNPKNAVASIRKYYCKYAVETKEQEEYVKRILLENPKTGGKR